MQSVTSVISEVQKDASETGTSADAVLDAAREVSQLSERLKGSVDDFLLKIKRDNSQSADSQNQRQDKAA